MERWIRDDPYFRIVTSNPIPDKLIKTLQRAQMLEDEKHLLNARLGVIPLAPKEREVLLALGDGGFTRQEAADALGMTLDTIKIHIKSAKSKMKAKTTTQAIVRAIRTGMI